MVLRPGTGLYTRQNLSPAGKPLAVLARIRGTPSSLPTGHTSALKGGSQHSKLVVKTRQQFLGLLNTQKTIISITSLNVFLPTGIQQITNCHQLSQKGLILENDNIYTEDNEREFTMAP